MAEEDKKTYRTELRLDFELANKMRKLAKAKGWPMSAYARNAVRRAIEQDEKAARDKTSID